MYWVCLLTEMAHLLYLQPIDNSKVVLVACNIPKVDSPIFPELNVSTKEVCLHVYIIYLPVTNNGEVGEEKASAQPQLTSLLPTCKSTQETMVTSHINGRLISTNCRQMLQEHIVLFQSKIQCISGNFYLKEQNTLKIFFGKNLMSLKNGPLSKVKC